MSKLTTNVRSARKVRMAGLDKFYTIPAVAENCIKIVGKLYAWANWGLVVEPSAGNGSFLTRLPTTNRIGIDIEPENDPSGDWRDEIIEQDFLTYSPPIDTKNILVIGNPPFGRVSSLAIKFFNHASRWATIIAFILPRTFRRISVQNKLDRYMHIVHDSDIPVKPCSFSPPMTAKCCFQIWEKRSTKRTIINLVTRHKDWEFLGFGANDVRGQPTPPNNADFAIRAYGGNCGEIIMTGLEHLRPKSWHWIRAKINKATLATRFRALDYSLSTNTARQNSIGKGELVLLYSTEFG